VSPIFLNRSLFREARSLYKPLRFCNFFGIEKSRQTRADGI